MENPQSFAWRILQGMAYVLAYLPGFVQTCLVHALAFLGFHFDRKGRRILELNVTKIYGLPAHSQFSRLFAKQVYRSLVRNAIEAVTCLLHPTSIVVDGLDEYRARVQDLEKGGPVIACTAHLGAWELAGYCCHLASSRGFVALAKASRSSALTQFLNWLRLRFCKSVLYAGRQSILRDVLSALKTSMVGFVADQKPQARQGITVDFFGIPTEFVSGPEKFASKTQAAVIALFVLRIGPRRFQIFSEVIKGRQGDPDCEREGEVEGALTQRLAHCMESYIRRYPEQWAWNYKRWRWQA